MHRAALAEPSGEYDDYTKTMQPDRSGLGCTKEQEVATQRQNYRYGRDRGIDVTSEYANCFKVELH